MPSGVGCSLGATVTAPSLFASPTAPAPARRRGLWRSLGPPPVFTAVVASLPLLDLVGPLADAGWPVELAAPHDAITPEDHVSLVLAVLLLAAVGVCGGVASGSWRSGAFAGACCAFVAGSLALAPPAAAHAQLPYLACVGRGEVAANVGAVATLLASVAYPVLASLGSAAVGALLGGAAARVVCGPHVATPAAPLPLTVAMSLVGVPTLLASLVIGVAGAAGLALAGWAVVTGASPDPRIAPLWPPMLAVSALAPLPLVVAGAWVWVGRHLRGLVSALPRFVAALLALAGIVSTTVVASALAWSAKWSQLGGWADLLRAIDVHVESSVVVAVGLGCGACGLGLAALGAWFPRPVVPVDRPVGQTLDAISLTSVGVVAVVAPLMLVGLGLALGGVSMIQAVHGTAPLDLTRFEQIRSLSEELRFRWWLGLVGRVWYVGTPVVALVGLLVGVAGLRSRT